MNFIVIRQKVSRQKRLRRIRHYPSFHVLSYMTLLTLLVANKFDRHSTKSESTKTSMRAKTLSAIIPHFTYFHLWRHLRLKWMNFIVVRQKVSRRKWPTTLSAIRRSGSARPSIGFPIPDLMLSLTRPFPLLLGLQQWMGRGVSSKLGRVSFLSNSHF